MLSSDFSVPEHFSVRHGFTSTKEPLQISATLLGSIFQCLAIQCPAFFLNPAWSTGGPEHWFSSICSSKLPVSDYIDILLCMCACVCIGLWVPCLLCHRAWMLGRQDVGSDHTHPTLLPGRCWAVGKPQATAPGVGKHSLRWGTVGAGLGVSGPITRLGHLVLRLSNWRAS